MKISNAVFALLAIGITGLQAQTPSATSQVNVPPPTDYQVVQQDANSRVWQRETYVPATRLLDIQKPARQHQPRPIRRQNQTDRSWQS